MKDDLEKQAKELNDRLEQRAKEASDTQYRQADLFGENQGAKPQVKEPLDEGAQLEEEEGDEQEETDSEPAPGPLQEEDDCGSESDPKQAKAGKGAVTKAKPATSKLGAPAEPTFTFPFHIRYASEVLWNVTGFVDGQKYTSEQIRELLIASDYTEFQDIEPVFHRSDATNTLVITIKGSKKAGAGGLVRSIIERFYSRSSKSTTILINTIPSALLSNVEATFMSTFVESGTEDRALVYVDDSGNLGVVRPHWTRHRAFVYGDLPLTMELNGRLWDLAFDLHSHHVMDVSWSPTDNTNERIRGPVFGVCSWKHGGVSWGFRRWGGPQVGFENLRYVDVVTEGSRTVQYLEAPSNG